MREVKLKLTIKTNVNCDQGIKAMIKGYLLNSDFLEIKQITIDDESTRI